MRQGIGALARLQLAFGDLFQFKWVILTTLLISFMNIFVILRATIRNSLKLVVNDIQPCAEDQKRIALQSEATINLLTHITNKSCVRQLKIAWRRWKTKKHVAHESCFACAWGLLLGPSSLLISTHLYRMGQPIHPS